MNVIEKYLQGVLNFSERINAIYLVKHSALDMTKAENIQKLICGFNKVTAVKLCQEIENNWKQIIFGNATNPNNLLNLSGLCLRFLESDFEHAEELGTDIFDKNQIETFSRCNIERLKKLQTILRVT